MNDRTESLVPRIGVICGNDSAPGVIRDPDVGTQLVGNNDSFSMLKHLEPAIDFRRVHLAPSYFRQTFRYDFSRYDLVWNAISDEIQNAKTLGIAQKLIGGLKVPVVNPPALIPLTSRVKIAEQLQGIDGVVAPKVLMFRNPTRERVARLAQNADFRFPAILRKTGTHNGEVVGIFEDLDSLGPIFGDRKSEYNLIEFVDVRRADGFYRKTRFFFVGDQILTRQHIVSDEWSIHSMSSRRIMPKYTELQEEARDLIVNGFAALPTATRNAIHDIRRRVGLDYCGLDCYLAEDGGVVVYECNATMNFAPTFGNPATQYNRASFPRYLSALRRLIHAKTGKGPAF